MTDRAGGMDERDVDELFASIISRWDSALPSAQDPLADAADPRPDQPGEPHRPDPTAEPEAIAEPEATAEPDEAATPDGSAPPEGTDPSAAPPEKPTRPSWVNPSPMDGVLPSTAWRAPVPTPTGDATTRPGADAEPETSDDEHFEPPDVRLPPQEDLHFWGAVLGLVAGPLMLLYVAMARPFHSTRWFIAAVVVSVLGFTLLVLRQPRHRDPTSGDDGARL